MTGHKSVKELAERTTPWLVGTSRDRRAMRERFVVRAEKDDTIEAAVQPPEHVK